MMYPDSQNSVERKMPLSLQQQIALDAALCGASMFITGPGGVGKSHLLGSIIEALRAKGRKIAVTASTGIAAINIGGCTLHAFVGAGLATDPVEKIITRLAKNRRTKDRWTQTKVLVIDEISMVDPDFFEKVSQIGCALRKNEQAFGGLQVIITGDFYQLPPVTKNGQEPRFVFETDTWTRLNPTIVHLTQPFRQKNLEFFGTLNRIRDGSFTDSDIEKLKTRINQKLEHPSGILPTMLHSRNADVDSVNQACLAKLPGEQVRYNMLTTFLASPDATVDKKTEEDLIATAKKNCTAQDVLLLKPGAQVMLLKNMDVMEGLANGSRGIVTSTEDLGAWVQFLSSEQPVFVAYEEWKMHIPQGIITLRQIPLKLAWSLTIHKSQSASIDFVEIRLDETVFAEGQAYVALSRVRTFEGLCLLSFNPAAILTNKKVKTWYDNLGK